MQAEDLARRLLVGLNSGAKSGNDSPATPAGTGSTADAPTYVYGDSAAGIFSIFFMIQPGDPGQGAAWLAQVGLNFAGGVGIFASNVEFQEGSVQRTGWIYQFVLGSDEFAVYFPDYQDGAGMYDCAETTLPYTPGQPPAGLDQSMPLRRFPS